MDAHRIPSSGPKRQRLLWAFLGHIFVGYFSLILHLLISLLRFFAVCSAVGESSPQLCWPTFHWRFTLESLSSITFAYTAPCRSYCGINELIGVIITPFTRGG